MKRKPYIAMSNSALSPDGMVHLQAQEENCIRGSALIGQIKDESSGSDVIDHERARASTNSRFIIEVG
ncbi:hypothetical protein E1301_Tti008557 [Triplophysa tibetana]|uniref:Uncharacterized protein n=1 Tax=Triplophysa tibetana TaxID=1572043 RepID=A0A5A9P1C6_9TELE|nr:hypothetical protein E1301_Tti008557 [Triplophysa tibetana]